jgi:patatin-related protein
MRCQVAALETGALNREGWRLVASADEERSTATDDEPVREGERSETRELRLAVVLYGGVSLAIYMHGTTKELHRLVKASALEDRAQDGTVTEGDATPSERVYRDLLRDLATRNGGVRTRVVVDVVAGTSAGGINGVYLAKALAHNRSQDALRDLWLDRGDITKLLNAPGWMPAIGKAGWALARARKRSPLKGDEMARWMYHALRDMDAAGSRPEAVDTLMPPRHVLDLFITTTDFQGYDRDLMIADPRLIHDRTHRHVLAFRYGDGHDDFTGAHNGALAFSARVTSSFPGAFPPVSFETFKRYLAEDDVDLARLGPGFFRLYQLSRANPEKTFFVDGGILDNRPFGHAIRAIKQKPAEYQVDRKLLYLEPDPGGRGRQAASLKEPNPIATILAAVSGIPRKEPILDDILAVSRQNERVRRIRDVIETTFAPIAAEIAKIVGPDLTALAEGSDPEQLNEWRTQINEKATEAAGFAHATYIRSKVSGVVDRYARTICRLSDYPEDCNQAAFVRAVLRSWATRRLFGAEDGPPVPVQQQLDFLRTFDLEYGARRLKFVIDGVSWYYRDIGRAGFPTRAELNDAKAKLWEAHQRLTDLMDGRNVPTELTEEVLAVFAQEPIDDWVYERRSGPEEYAEARAQELAKLEQELGKALDTALAGFSKQLYDDVREVVRGWHADRRKEMLVRFLGFPFWDILLYPLQSVGDVGERDAIEIVRMSPRDATVLPPLEAGKPKHLSGFEVMHFGAFFDRAGRENDYLWGRLDGAERLIHLLLGRNRSDEELARWCRKAFAAIVEEEGQNLPKAERLLAHARDFASG